MKILKIIENIEYKNKIILFFSIVAPHNEDKVRYLEISNQWTTT